MKPDSPPPVIEIRDLDFSYDGALVLEKVNLTVRPLESICLVGPNGGGKTTLVKLILGLLRPNRGRVLVFGSPPRQSRLRIGYVPQYARYDPQFPVTLLDVVLMGRLGQRLGGRYSRQDRQRAMDCLALMKLDHLAHQLFAAISGGQRQRVLIARALACEAELLILDEPTANIDVLTESNLFSLLKHLNASKTIMVVTHDVGFASTFFQHVACVNRRVVTHPTSKLTGEMIQNIYDGEVCMIRHDHRQEESRHE